MNYLKLILVFTFVFLLKGIGNSQDWVSYQSQGQINDLVEEENELLLATDVGIVIVDKNTLETSFINKSNTDLTNNHIAAIAKSSSGDNWIGTYDVVISRVEGSDIVDSMTPDSEFYDQYTELYDFEFAPNGDLWIGTSDGVFHKQGDTWLHYGTDELGSDFFRAWDVHIDPEGDVYIGSNSLHKFSGGVWTNILEEVSLLGYLDSEAFFSSNGDIFFGGDLDAIGRFDGENWELYEYDDFLVSSFFNGSQFIGFTEDAEGNVYFNTQFDGTFRLENNLWVPYVNAQTEAFDNETSFFYIDAEGKQWLNKNIHLSVNDNGIIQSTTISEQTIEWNGMLGVNKGDNGEMAFLSYIDNFSIVDTDGAWSSFRVPSEVTDGQILTDFLYLGVDDVWVTTNLGLYHYEGIDWSFFDLGFCNNLVKSTDGKIYVGSSGKVFIIEEGLISEYNPSNSPITNAIISGLGLDANGNLWVASSEDNFIHTVNSAGVWTTYSGADFPEIDKPQGDFHFDSEGNTWIASDIVGVMKFDGTTWTNPYLGNFDEIENINVHSIESDATGKMYFAHHVGVTTLFEDEWENLIIEDIPSNLSHDSEIKFDDAGTLWFANSRYGVFSYTPETMTAIPSYFNTITSKFTTYPNPASGYFTLDFSINEKANVQTALYNNLGQLQSQLDLGVLPAGDFQQTFDIVDLPKGMYSVQLHIDGNSYAKTIVIQ